ncbi:magnesium ion transporter [Kappamyces sp. JEL0829]|nr:magnesium ion transporter [Kappamyces sp. JEL0829]
MTALILDSNGNVTEAEEGELGKIKICEMHGLHPRDLRILDSTNSDQLSAILVRESSILLNLLSYKALIKADRTILVSHRDEKELYTASFLEQLSSKLKSNAGQYEFLALEVILINVVARLKEEQATLFRDINCVLDQLDVDIGQNELKGLLTSRRLIDSFDTKVQSIRSIFVSMLNNDDDLAKIYLTDKLNGEPHKSEDHDEAELLFEHYLSLVDEIHQATQQISSNLAATQAFTNVILNSTRNRLISYELRATLATAAISGGGLVAALFGMNLANGMEATPGLFSLVSASALLLIALIYGGSSLRMRMLMRGNLRGMGVARPKNIT